MVKLFNVFQRLQPVHVLVVGDFMMDRYTFGRVERISPEAPVPILHVTSQKDLPGGAGNVALNLSALDCRVSVLGRIGNDSIGKNLLKLFRLYKIDTKGLLVQENYQTILKNRLISDSQQLLRIDLEEKNNVSSMLYEQVQAFLKKEKRTFDVIAISDYAKGFLTREILADIIAYGKERNIPIIVDPKGIDFTKYSGATLIKPNRKEAYQAAGCETSEEIKTVGFTLFSQIQADHLLITRSEDGISLFNAEGEFHFPIISKEVVDVTGAGDSVLAMLSLGLGNRIALNQIIPIANIAAGICVEYVGCVNVSKQQIAKRILSVEKEEYILDEEHLDTLIDAIDTQNYTIICLDDEEKNSLTIFHTIKDFARHHPDHTLIIQLLRPYSNRFISFISSLVEVDYVLLFHEKSLENLQRFEEKNIYHLVENRLMSEVNFANN